MHPYYRLFYYFLLRAANLDPEPVKIVLVGGVKPETPIRGINLALTENNGPIGKRATYVGRIPGPVAGSSVHPETEPIGVGDVHDVVVFSLNRQGNLTPSSVDATDSFEFGAVGKFGHKMTLQLR
jgi:hypothetical protein